MWNLNTVLLYFYVALLWSGYGFLHSLLVSIRFTDWIRIKTGRLYAYYRLVYNCFSLILLAWLFAYTHHLDPHKILKFTGIWTAVQTMLLTGSALIFVMAFFAYDPLEFIGLRQIMGVNRDYGLKRVNSENISRRGILGFVRHPMYLATIIGMWSLNSSRLDLIVHAVLTIYILVGIELEEKKLIVKFGTVYEDYRKQVPALIPFSIRKQKFS